MTRLRSGCSGVLTPNCKFFSPPNRPHWLWGPPSFLFYVHRDGFPWLKRRGRHDDLSPPFSAEVKNEWSCASTPLYTFMVWVGTDLRFLPTLIIRCFNFFNILLDFSILDSWGCGFELYLYGYLSTWLKKFCDCRVGSAKHLQEIWSRAKWLPKS